MRQDNFSGGMSALLDATKTPANQYRAGLNVRVRRNALEPAFRHKRVPTTAAVHQAVFAIDDTLIVVIGGVAYRLIDDPHIGGSRLAPIAVTGLSPTADRVYHQTVPAPTNYFVGSASTTHGKQYVSTVSTTPLLAVLQDGVTQPRLLSNSLLAVWPAKSYAEWSYDHPEYVPIGKQMAFTGTKLFIVSADGMKVYQSVSGRPLDFVLNFDNDGIQQGDAASTSLAVATAPLTGIVPSQEGGFVAATLYKMHMAQPVDGVEAFGETYLRPVELFSVGAVSQYAYTSIKGETVFVSPVGLQMFNQVQQLKRESNNSPMGWPILSYIKRPIVAAACTTVNDYSFFALETVFGPGIVVYDNILDAFVSIDLTDTAVKEFAVLQRAGQTRLFYITEGEELYEIPLYEETADEKATATVYFGEWVPRDKTDQPTPRRRHSLDSVVVGLSNVRTAGHLIGHAYTDKQESGNKLVEVERDTDLQTAATDFPIFTEMPSAAYPLSFPDQQNGYAIGLRLDLTADARIVSLDVALTDVVSDAPREVTVVEPLWYVMFGNFKADGRQFVDFDTEVGRQLYAESTSSGQQGWVLNGDEKIWINPGHAGQSFTARADRIFLSDVAVYDYTTSKQLLAAVPGAATAFVLGVDEVTDTYAAVFRFFQWHGVTPYASASDFTQQFQPRAADFFGWARVPLYTLIEERDINFFCVSFPAVGGGPSELAANGKIARWIKAIAAQSGRKINILVSAVSPHDAAVAATFGAWPFAAMGLHAVISAGEGRAYAKTTADGLPIFDIGQAGCAMKIESAPRSATLSFYDITGITDTATLIV